MLFVKTNAIMLCYAFKILKEIIVGICTTSIKFKGQCGHLSHLVVFLKSVPQIDDNMQS